jgi:hypothetical protein
MKLGRSADNGQDVGVEDQRMAQSQLKVALTGSACRRRTAELMQASFLRYNESNVLAIQAFRAADMQKARNALDR